MTSSAEATGGTWSLLRTPAGVAFLGLGILVLAQGAAPGAVAAQAVRGEIRDAETGQPVAAARVVVRNEAGVVLSEVNAQPSGSFTLLGLPQGPLVLEVSAVGYAVSGGTPIDHKGESLFLDIELDPDPLAGDGIQVTVEYQDPYLADRGYYLRQRSGHGYFLTTDNMSLLDPSDMFQRVAAVKVVHDEPVITRGDVSFRECRPAVYQDGMLVRSEFSDVAFNDVVAPSTWIEAVEIYPGPATAPAQWRGSAGCGLIVVWTER